MSQTAFIGLPDDILLLILARTDTLSKLVFHFFTFQSFGSCFRLSLHHIDGAVRLLLKCLRNPKILVEQLVVDFRCGSFLRPDTIDKFNDAQRKLTEQIQKGLNSLNHKISARQFQIYFWGGNQNYILSILPFLKPKTLESISIHNVPYRSAGVDYFIKLDDVAELEQWKLAKEFNLRKYNLGLPLRKWSHFSESNVRVECISLDDVKIMISVSRKASST